MKNIFVVTSTRADYGLLKPVIAKISNSEKLTLTVVATGTHLMASFGNTIDEIEKDGFAVKYKFDILKFGTDSLGVAKTISHIIDVFSQLFYSDKPDLVLVLGDRYEIFAVATSASTIGIPIAHISGGDVTAGAKDDFYRHCITQMSAIHFASCLDSYKRLLRLGQSPDTVYNVGGLGDENIRTMPLFSKDELQGFLDITLEIPFAIITYHPETQSTKTAASEMQKLLDALDKTSGLQLIFTKANADVGGESINNLIDDYCEKNHSRSKAFFSLGSKGYLSAMKYCRLVIGNSSSGVVETPTFKTPCVNIGDRQKGRFIASNIICTKTETDDILKGIKTALSEEFMQIAKVANTPYYSGFVPSDEIVKHITEFVYSDKNKIKTFYDGE